jgi:hypothetical protein
MTSLQPALLPAASVRKNGALSAASLTVPPVLVLLMRMPFGDAFNI